MASYPDSWLKFDKIKKTQVKYPVTNNNTTTVHQHDSSGQPPLYAIFYRGPLMFIIQSKVNSILTPSTEDSIDAVQILSSDEFLEVSHNLLDNRPVLANHLDYPLQCMFSKNKGSLQKMLFTLRESDSKPSVIQKIPAISQCKILVEELKWEHLSPAYQQDLLKYLVILNPNEKPGPFSDLANLVENFEETLLLHLDESLLLDLIYNKIPTLFANRVPANAEVYIPRKLMSRQIYFPLGVLTRNIKDVFLFTGIPTTGELTYLLSRSENIKCETSSDVIKNGKLSTRYVLLMDPNHFNSISKISSNPVHWLHLENNRLYWRKSEGGLNAIQSSMLTHNEEITEDEFQQQLQQNEKNHVIISGKPGLGKSELLLKLAHSLHDPRKLMVYTTMTQLISEVYPCSTTLIESIEKVIIKKVSHLKFGKALVKNSISCGRLQINLMLDGFDEVHECSRKYAVDSLKMVGSLPYIRLFVSTRGQHLKMLEEILRVKGYKLCPFKHNEQIQLLTSYWLKMSKPKQTRELATRAELCLEIFKSMTNKENYDITGNPMLCTLLAQISANKKLEGYDNSKSRAARKSWPTFSVTSLIDLCDQFCKLKLSHSDLGDLDINEFKVKCAPEAVRVLFPQRFEGSSTEWLEKLEKVGIMVKGVANEPRFIHRIFAEYIVGWLVAEWLTERQEPYTMVTPLIFGKVLSTRRLRVMEIQWYREPFVDFTFRHSTLCHFLSSALHHPSSLASTVKNGKIMDLVQEKMGPVVAACVHDNFEGLFNFLASQLSPSPEIFNDKLVAAAVVQATPKLFISVVNCFKASWKMQLHDIWYNFDLIDNISSVNLDNNHPIISLALCRGSFPIVYHLLNYEGYLDTVLSTRVPTLLHILVDHTKNDTKTEIEERLEILRKLVQINPKLLQQSNSEGITPLLCPDVHLELLLEMIRLGGEVCAKGMSVAHKAAEYMSNKEYHKFVTSIPEKTLKKMLVHCHSIYRMNPLQYILCRLPNPLVETIDLFAKHGANFNPSFPILHFAIRNNQRAEIIQRLVDHGADFREVDDKGKTVFHVAVPRLRFELLETFMSLGTCITAEDNAGNTPLHSFAHHVRHLRTPLRFSEDDLNDITPSLQNRMAEGLSISNITQLPRFELFLNARNKYGETPLHLATKNPNRCAIEVYKLLSSFGAYLQTAQTKTGETSLHLAARHGVPEVVRYILQDFNISTLDDRQQFAVLLTTLPDLTRSKLTENLLQLQESPYFCTLLSYMKREESWTMTDVSQCLTHGCSFHHATSALRHFVKYQRFLSDDEAMEFLERLFPLIDPSQDLTYQNTLLHLACLTGNLSATNFLLRNGYNLNSPNPLGLTPFHLACQSSKRIAEDLIRLIPKTGIDFRAKSKLNRTPLHIAAFHGNWPIIRKLAKNSDINAKDVFGNTPLHLAMSSHVLHEVTRVYTIETLLDSKAEVNAFNALGLSPIDYSLFVGKVCLDYNHIDLFVNVDDNDNDGDNDNGGGEITSKTATALISAIMDHLCQPSALEDNEDTKESLWNSVQYFITHHDANPNILDSKGRSLAHCAAIANWPLQLIQNLMESSLTQLSDKNLKDNDGNTVLHYAATSGNLDVIKYLISSGLDLDSKNNSGSNFLHCISNLLSLEEYHSIVELVMERQSDILFYINSLGETPLHVAMSLFPVLPDTLNLYAATSAEIFNVSNLKQETVLSKAILGGHSGNYLSQLLKQFNCTPTRNVLHEACFSGNLEAVHLFIDRRHPVNSKDHNGDTPLHLSFRKMSENFKAKGEPTEIRRIDHRIIYSLLAHGAKAHITNSDQETPIHFKSWRTGLTPLNFHVILEKMMKLTKVDVPFGAQDSVGRTTLHCALLHVDLLEPTIDLFAKHKLTVFATLDKIQNSALSCAVIGGRYGDIIRRTIHHNGTNVWDANIFGNTPLHYAAFFGNLPAVRILTEEVEGVDVNVRNNLGDTPLHLLFKTKNQKDLIYMAYYILKKGGNVNATNAKGRTPLHVGVKRCKMQRSLIRLLEDHGADFGVMDKKGNSLFHEACQGKGSLKLLNHLLLLGCDPLAANVAGVTPLHFAVKRGNLKAARFLLENGEKCVANACDEFGVSPLQQALTCENRGEEWFYIIKLLIEAGAVLDLRKQFHYKLPTTEVIAAAVFNLLESANKIY